MLVALGGLMYLVSLVCFIIILIDAFKNEVWKGIVSLVCGLYALYYAFAEFQHKNKGAIIAGWILGSLVGWGLIMAGGGGHYSYHVGTP